MSELDKELTAYNSEKRMDEVALSGYQHTFSERLNGSMGDDMMKVLNGERTVEIVETKKKSWIDKMLELF